MCKNEIPDIATFNNMLNRNLQSCEIDCARAIISLARKLVPQNIMIPQQYINPHHKNLINKFEYKYCIINDQTCQYKFFYLILIYQFTVKCILESVC